MDDPRGLTPGDPLGGAPERAEASTAYGGRPVPPGAFAPRRERPPAPPPEQLASFGARAVAYVIDLLVVAAVSAALIAAAVALFAGGGGSDTEGDSFLVEPGIGLIVWTVLALGLVPVVSVLYTPLLMRATNGRTLGKLVCGIRVQRTDGRPVGLWWAAYREVLVKGVVVGVAGAMTGGIALVVDFAWPLWDGQNRAVHDLVVDSRVVRA